MRELFSNKIPSVPRALKRHHAKRGASAEAEVRENAKYTTDEQKQSKYAGGGFAFARLILKSFLGLVSAPQEGAGGMRGGNSFGFLAGAMGGKNTSKMLKSFYES